MKKIVLVSILLLTNITLLSCTADSLAETDATYLEQSTEGEDGEVVTPPGN
ncbi:hypothetical protein [Sediminicola arcticus]|uniref:Secreted protein n=1 Tax=Sediminicola arcticus TaxID=1574308 RepID=A0ABV2SPR7_9FLAO